MHKLYQNVFCFLVFLGQLHSFTIEGRILGFRPDESYLRDIYGPFWTNYQLEISQSLAPSSCLWKRLNVFATGDYLFKNGETIAGENRTKIQFAPITLGLKWVQPINSLVDLYIGAGPRYSFIWVKSYSPFVDHKISRSSFGGYLTAGSNFHLNSHFFLDVAAGYSFQKFSAPHTPPRVDGTSLTMNGFYLGGGLGFIF